MATALATALQPTRLPRTLHLVINPTVPDEASLVAASQRGDQRATEALLQRFMPLVRRVCRRFFLPGGTDEDLMQEGLIGVYQAIRDWRPTDRRMSISDYVNLCVRNQVVRAVRMATRHKHKLLSKSMSLDAESSTVTPRATTLSPEDEVLGELALEDWQALMFIHLSELERTVLQMKAREIDTEDVAIRLGVPRKQIDNALFRARRKLTEAASTADMADAVLRPLTRKRTRSPKAC